VISSRPGWTVPTVFVVTALFIGAVGAVGYRSVRDLVQAAELQTQSQEVLAGIERVGRLMRDAESARRGYALTLDESHRTAHREAAERTRSALTELRRLTAHNRQEQRRLDELEPLVHDRLAQLAASIERLHSGRTEPGLTAAETRAGALADAPIQRLLGDMSDEERELLEKGDERTLARARLSRALIVGATGLAILVLAGAAALVVRASLRQRRAEQRAVEGRKLLEAANLESSARSPSWRA
jgi:CHASE3 domain sensor protein